METSKVNVDELQEYPGNPREISARERKGLKNSIKRFGLVKPLIYNKETGHVVGGNQRLKIIRELGWDEVDVVQVELSEEEEHVSVPLEFTTILGLIPLLCFRNRIHSLPHAVTTAFVTIDLLPVVRDCRVQSLPFARSTVFAE